MDRRARPRGGQWARVWSACPLLAYCVEKQLNDDRFLMSHRQQEQREPHDDGATGWRDKISSSPPSTLERTSQSITC